MKKTIAKISGTLATIGVVAIIISNFVAEYGYIPFWIGVVVFVLSGIAYLATGEKPKEWFLDMMDWF